MTIEAASNTCIERTAERARSVKASASEHGVQRPKTFGSGLGWREAHRRGLGTAQVLSESTPARRRPSGYGGQPPLFHFDD
jgi:hypothetical protein